jgi:hypothetical protein
MAGHGHPACTNLGRSAAPYFSPACGLPASARRRQCEPVIRRWRSGWLGVFWGGGGGAAPAPPLAVGHHRALLQSEWLRKEIPGGGGDTPLLCYALRTAHKPCRMYKNKSVTHSCTRFSDDPKFLSSSALCPRSSDARAEVFIQHISPCDEPHRVCPHQKQTNQKRIPKRECKTRWVGAFTCPDKRPST